MPVILDLLNPQKIYRLRQTVEDYAKLQVIPIRNFRFIVNIHTHPHTQRDKVIAISAPPYYIVRVYSAVCSGAGGADLSLITHYLKYDSRIWNQSHFGYFAHCLCTRHEKKTAIVIKCYHRIRGWFPSVL